MRLGRDARASQNAASQSRARRFTRCGRWRWRLAKTARRRGGLIGNKIVHPPAIDVGFAVEAEDGVLVPVFATRTSSRLRELTARYNELVELARQRRLPPRRHRRLHCHGDQFRDVRADVGHADSAAGTNARAGHGRGATDVPSWDAKKRPVCAGDGSESDAEF